MKAAVGRPGCSVIGSVHCHSADKRAYPDPSAPLQPLYQHRLRHRQRPSVAEHNSRTQGDEQAQAASHLGASIDQ
jgi:hypothetical protein